MARLERLDLADSGVSDAGLNRVRGLAHLTWLSLYDCRVTDAGLDDLKGLTRLRTLVLGETQVTDAGLDRLKGFRQLRDLYLPHDRVTPDGVARLQRALPKCEISFAPPASSRSGNPRRGPQFRTEGSTVRAIEPAGSRPGRNTP